MGSETLRIASLLAALEVFECIQKFEGPVQLFRRHVANADTFADFSDEWNSLSPMSVFNGVLAGLPGEFWGKMGRSCWKIQSLHATEYAFHSIHRDEPSHVAQQTTEEAIDIYGFTVHNIHSWNHLK